MRHLKLFESFEIEKMDREYREQIEECFYDIRDDGWLVRIRLDKKGFSSLDKDQMIKIDFLPYIEIVISKSDIASEVFKLKDTDLFKNSISHLGALLDDIEFYISRNYVCKRINGGNEIRIIIYRKSDKLKVEMFGKTIK
jgi:hypothetical protein